MIGVDQERGRQCDQDEHDQNAKSDHPVAVAAVDDQFFAKAFRRRFHARRRGLSGTVASGAAESMAISDLLDTRVKEAVRQVRDQVGDHDGDAADEEHTLQHGIVVGIDRVIGQQTDSGVAEHRFDDDCAA